MGHTSLPVVLAPVDKSRVLSLVRIRFWFISSSMILHSQYEGWSAQSVHLHLQHSHIITLSIHISFILLCTQKGIRFLMNMCASLYCICNIPFPSTLFPTAFTQEAPLIRRFHPLNNLFNYLKFRFQNFTLRFWTCCIQKIKVNSTL